MNPSVAVAALAVFLEATGAVHAAPIRTSAPLKHNQVIAPLTAEQKMRAELRRFSVGKRPGRDSNKQSQLAVAGPDGLGGAQAPLAAGPGMRRKPPRKPGSSRERQSISAMMADMAAEQAQNEAAAANARGRKDAPGLSALTKGARPAQNASPEQLRKIQRTRARNAWAMKIN